jgi:hypothetical protein
LLLGQFCIKIMLFDLNVIQIDANNCIEHGEKKENDC